MNNIKIIYKSDKKYPQNFLELNNAPDKIYVEGNIELLNKLSISIVGSRNCSDYGEKISRMFAKDIVKLGIVTVSGLALGVDSFVHEESIINKGETIAVLPSGLKNMYPKSNKELFDNIILKGGLVLSEYEPYEIADSKKFIQRNRLVSALGECLIVTEAAYRSGTSITARLAKEQGKKVFCVPSRLDNKSGIGTNKMIKNGASLLSGISDIFEEVNNKKIQEYRERYKEDKKVKNNQIRIPWGCKKIYNTVQNRLTSIDYIFSQSNESISDISYKLTLLELEGLIKSMPGGFYKKIS